MAFPLHPQHHDHVARGDRLVERLVGVAVLHVFLRAAHHDLHPQACHDVVVGVRHPRVGDVPCDDRLEPLEAAEFLPDRQQIEEALGWMASGAVAAV